MRSVCTAVLESGNVPFVAGQHSSTIKLYLITFQNVLTELDYQSLQNPADTAALTRVKCSDVSKSGY